MKVLAMAAAVVAIATAAAADPVKPWTRGVSQETQAKANKLFAAANELFAQQAHAPAIEKYRAALAIWDHPLIRFNLAVTLIRLDRILDAAEELERSLQFGAAPFPKETYQQALDYQVLLKGRVGVLEASCQQRAAHVLLDGKPWFDCPGKERQRVMAGAHAVVGESEGFVTSSERALVVGGEATSIAINLVSLDAAVQLTYRYPRWLPWTIAGGGGALVLAGVGMWLAGRSELDQFAKDLQRSCPAGCDLSMQPSLSSERSGANLKREIGVGVMVVGGAAAIGGIVLAIINKPQRTLPVEVVPTRGGAAAYASWRF